MPPLGEVNVPEKLSNCPDPTPPLTQSSLPAMLASEKVSKPAESWAPTIDVADAVACVRKTNVPAGAVLNADALCWYAAPAEFAKASVSITANDPAELVVDAFANATAHTSDCCVPV